MQYFVKIEISLPLFSKVPVYKQSRHVIASLMSRFPVLKKKTNSTLELNFLRTYNDYIVGGEMNLQDVRTLKTRISKLSAVACAV